jgi:hypothetical protein
MLRRLSRATPPMQCKLEIGAIDDPLETEADRAADHVMRMPAPPAPDKNGASTLRRQCAACDDEDQKLQKKSDGPGATSPDAPQIVHQALGAPSHPLDTSARAFMEPRFGQDFAHIRIHTDPTAARSAKELNARAYTIGNSIVFAQGEFAPRSEGGQKLLAHELAHTQQQNGQPQLIQRSPDKDDDDSAPSKPRDATVTQSIEGSKVTYREQLNRGRDHALLIRIMDLGAFPPTAQERLYRGQELPGMRGNKTEISWVDVTNEARRDGPLAVDWNMPDVDSGDKGKQQEKDRQIANQHPNPVLSLLVPMSNAYVKDRSSEIHDPLIRSQYQIDRQGIEAGTNLGRVTGAVLADTVAALSFAPAIAEAASALAPEGLYAARAVYLNAPAIYASGVLYSGAAMTGAALAAHMQKIRSKGFDSSDIPQLAEDLLPAVGGYLEAQSFNTNAPNGKPSGPANPGGATPGETAEPDIVFPRPAQFDSQTRKISGTVIRPGTGETFDAEIDPATGNGQIVERASRRIVGIIRNGEIEKPPAAALPAGQSAAARPAASPATPPPSSSRPPVGAPTAAPTGTARPPAKPTTQHEMDEIAAQRPGAARPIRKPTTQREMDELAAQQKQTVSAKVPSTVPAVLDPSMPQNLRPAELQTAQRLASAYPEFNGRTFKAPPPPDPGHDWVDDLNRTYDAMGDGTTSKFFKWDEFKESIDWHVAAKGNDFTVIDATGYEPVQVAQIKAYVDSLPPAQQSKIRRIGF